MRLAAALWLTLALPLAAEEISLQTPTGPIYGTLLVPANVNAQVPLVVIIAGSGATDRNGNSSSGLQTDAYKMLAEGLLRYKIATLRYDKRGAGASAGSIPRVTDFRFGMYVDDAVAWGAKLRADGRFSSLSYAGHSEGSLVAILAAQQIPAEKLISIAGAGERAGDLILWQFRRDNEPAAVYAAAENIVRSLQAGESVPDVPPALYSWFAPVLQPYLISWFRFDPAVEISNLIIPVLLIQGTTDVQVPVEQAERLAAAAPFAHLLILDGMNHMMKDVSGNVLEQLPSYSDPSLPVDSRVVDAIATFVVPKAKRRIVVR